MNYRNLEEGGEGGENNSRNERLGDTTFSIPNEKYNLPAKGTVEGERTDLSLSGLLTY